MGQFNAAATANGWDDVEKSTASIVALRGDALEILQSIPEDKQNDFALLCEHLERRFGQKYMEDQKVIEPSNSPWSSPIV